MALTSQEKLTRRLTDPYYGLAEELAPPSLANQKHMSNSIATIEKNRAIDPAQAMANEAAQSDGTDLVDIAESQLRQGWEQLYDFFSGAPAGDNELIRQEADIASGVTEQGRERLVGAPQGKVVTSLAGMLNDLDQGEYLSAGGQALDAAGNAVLAGPGTLADSFQVVPEIAAGALLARGGGGVGRKLLNRRVEKTKEGFGKLFDRVGKERDALGKLADANNANKGLDVLKGIPKAAGTMSLAVADITQRQTNEVFQETGVEPTRGEAATMYAVNMATMLPTPAIIKNLFIPDFKKHMKTEITTLAKNIKGGSNFKQILKRVGNGMGAVAKAGGAEAAQEYAQTWGEAINTQLVPGEREDFWKSVKEMFTDKQNNLDALAGAFLGAGAGGVAKAAITTPAVAAGATLDTAKGTAKVAAKTAVGGVKVANKAIAAFANNQAYKVLSQEERNLIQSEHNSRKVLVDAKVEKFESSVENVKGAKTMEQLRRNPEIAAVVDARMDSQELKPEDIKSKRDLERLKADVIRSYRGDIALLKTELAAQAGSAIAKKSAKNVGDATSNAATAAVRAVSPGVKAVIDTVKEYGPEAVKAVKELRSSTALGIIELAANAGKEQMKQIVEASKTLSLDDLHRTVAAVSNINPELTAELQQVVKDKTKALERAGVKTRELITKENLNEVVEKASELTKIATKNIAAVSSSINATVAGVISDLDALRKTEKAAKLIEQSQEFKDQVAGAMSRDNMVDVKRKLQRARTRLEKEAKEKGIPIVNKAVDLAADAIAKAKPVVKKAGQAVVDKAGDIGESIEKSAKERAATNLKISPTFQAVIDAVITTLRDPAQEDALVASAPDFVKQMKRYGVNNRAEFVLFIEQNPELNENMQFFQALDAEYPSNIIADEVSDVLSTLLLKGEQSFKDAYNRMNPPECKV